jgi:hypothetical protein
MRRKLIVKPVPSGYVATFERGVGCWGETRLSAIELLLHYYQPKLIRVAYEEEEQIQIPIRYDRQPQEA